MKGAGPTKNSDMPEIREPVRINFLVPYIEVYMYVTDVCIITQYCYIRLTSLSESLPMNRANMRYIPATTMNMRPICSWSRPNCIQMKDVDLRVQRH